MANLAIPHVDKKHVLQNTWYRTTRKRYCNCCNKIIDNGELYQYLFLSDGVKLKATLNLCLKCEVRYKNHILTFPTEEMRDAFYENFKSLIEECKELL